MKKRARNFLLMCGVIKSWKNATWRAITDVDEWNTQLEYLKSHGAKADVKNPNAPVWGQPFSYKIDKNYREYYIYLFFTDEKCSLHVWFINSIQPKKRAGQGRQANTIVKDLFLQFNGVSERKAFGYCDRAIISKCVPKQLYYIDESQKFKNIEHVSKADYSSHYPSNLCGLLPYWSDRTNKVVQGTVEPTRDYPFAYYIKSGHFAEYGRVDTHKWLNSPLCLRLFGDNYSPEVEADEDITILCKASQYNYDDTIKYMYEKKQAGEEINGISYKIILNASIGYKHLKNVEAKQNRLDHLAVVSLARANQKMLDLFERGRTLMIVVDSIIYKGIDEVGSRKKSLGKLYQEITDAKFRMRGVNQYAFEKDGEIINIAHSGFDNVNIEDIKCLKDIDNFSKKDIIKIEV